MSDAPPSPVPQRVAPSAITTAAVGLVLTTTPWLALALPEAFPVFFLLAFVGLWLSAVARRMLAAAGRVDAGERVAHPAERVMRAQLKLAALAAPSALLAASVTVTVPI